MKNDLRKDTYKFERLEVLYRHTEPRLFPHELYGKYTHDATRTSALHLFHDKNDHVVTHTALTARIWAARIYGKR
jgi:hypothetical protein